MLHQRYLHLAICYVLFASVFSISYLPKISSVQTVYAAQNIDTIEHSNSQNEDGGVNKNDLSQEEISVKQPINIEPVFIAQNLEKNKKTVLCNLSLQN